MPALSARVLPVSPLRLLAALASGLLLAAISPPIGLHWLHWLSFVPLIWALRDDDTPANLALGFVAGYAGVSTLFFWIAESIVRFSNIPPFVAMLLVHAFAFVFALPYLVTFATIPLLRRRIGGWWVVVTPAIQVCVEFFGPALFPYFQGVSQYRNPYTWQLASVTGVTGVSYAIMVANCALGEIVFRLREDRRIDWRPLAFAAAFLAVDVGFGAWRLPRVRAQVAALPRINVSQLQQGITMEERMSGSPREAMMAWLRMSQRLRGMPVDLVIWPEGATPYDPRGGRVGEAMANLAKLLNAPIVFGGGYAEEKTSEFGRRYVEQRNSIYLMGADGQLVDRYDKMVPLPFGEYLPFSDVFPILREWIRGPGDFQRGDRSVYFPLASKGATYTFTTPICYEAILGDFVRERLSDADLFVNVTNDGWFGDTAAPHQHAMLSAVRVMELGVPMVRIAYTGVSMNVDPSGAIHEETAPFTEVVRVVDTPVGRVPTVFAQFGNWFPWACSVAAAVAVGRAWRRQA